jgi:glutaminyl-tRNA synthetase
MSKPAKVDPSADPLIPLFTSIGLTKAKAVDAAKSPKNAAILKDIIETHTTVSQGKLDEKQASLIVALAGAISKSSGIGHSEREYVIAKIIEGKLKSVDQITGGHPFLALFASLVLMYASCRQIC